MCDTIKKVLKIVGIIAAIAGVLLNAILPGNDYEFGKNPDGDANLGINMENKESEKE